jgi:hypothetical protein
MEKETLAEGLFNSGKDIDIKDSISSAGDNPITIDRITKKLNYNNQCIIDEPHTMLHRYKSVLMKDRVWFSLDDERLKGKPDAISEVYYGTPDLWYLIMWANNALKPTELFGDAIQVIPMKTIVKVIQIAMSSQEEININAESIPVAEQSILVKL